MVQQPPSQLPPFYSSSPKIPTEAIDAPLQLFGFEFDEITPTKVSGRLLVTEKCCQPFKVLHGGVSALIAEALGSIGAVLAAGLKRVAGVQLSINHVKSAMIGDLVYAEATPISVGLAVQVWEIQIWKVDPSKPTSKIMISSSRLTVACNIRDTGNHANDPDYGLRRYARL